MTAVETRAKRQSGVGRRFGYLVSIVINAVMAYVINRSPGWETASFLTDRTPEVLGWVNASLAAGVIANVVYIVWDPPRLRALGDLATLAIGIVSMGTIWRVFPFDFTGWGFPWPTVLRVLLVVAIVGSAIGMLVALVNLVRGRRAGE